MNKLKKIEILEPCFVAGKLAERADVLEVDEGDASHMVGNGRAKWADKDAKAGKAPKAAEK